MLGCTVCAVSIDVDFASTPVSPLVPRRHLVTWAIPLHDGFTRAHQGFRRCFDSYTRLSCEPVTKRNAPLVA